MDFEEEEEEEEDGGDDDDDGQQHLVVNELKFLRMDENLLALV